MLLSNQFGTGPGLDANGSNTECISTWRLNECNWLSARADGSCWNVRWYCIARPSFIVFRLNVVFSKHRSTSNQCLSFRQQKIEFSATSTHEFC